jgi:GntR family transcriptional repressor for pyruvate dehydrogenase complex
VEQRGVFPLVPIQQVSVYSAVREQLSGLIEQGGYRPGDRLPSERQLAEALGVSRVAIREGLKVLESAGRVEIRRGAGTFVLYTGTDPIAASLLPEGPIDRSWLVQLIALRAAIEEKIVQLAVVRADGADVERLGEVLRRNEHDLPQSAEPGSLNLLFEAELARISGNSLLMAVQRAVHELWIDAWSRLGLTPDHKDLLHDEHVKILDAVRRHDVVEAVTAMACHVDRELPLDQGAPS